MKKDEIVLLREYLPKNITDFLCTHILNCYNRSKLGYEDGYIRKDSSSAYSMYGNLIFEDLLSILTKNVSEMLKLELIPTYSFFSLYEKGNELKKHTDREACEISMSLCLGYEPNDNKWPIHLDDKSIDLMPGDAVIYRGIDLTHWREPFGGNYQAQAFFHWNDKNGPYGDKYKFDGRKYLGEKVNE